MKNILSLILVAFFAVASVQAQTLEELKTKKADLEAQKAAKQAEADAFNGEIASLAGEIEILSGWQKGFGGIIGLNLNDANIWASNANPTSSSSNLSMSLTGFATRNKEKSFWRNSGNINLAWQGLRTDVVDTDFLSDRVTDLFTISSLAGYKLNQDIALSALGDFNSSIFNFLSPGSLDFGAGVTWTPHQIPNLYVVAHPLTYHIAFPDDGQGLKTDGGLGAKIKAEYARNFGPVSWTSSLGLFLPYSGSEIKSLPVINNDTGKTIEPARNEDREVSLSEYTWINTLAFTVWKKVGVGVSLGLRKSDYESSGKLQSYSNIGLSYGF